MAEKVAETYGKIQVQTVPAGVVLLVPQTEKALVLEGSRGPELLTDLLRALEPHFPVAKGGISIVFTAVGAAWQAGVPKSGEVLLVLRPGSTPGFGFQFTAETARKLGEALLDMAKAAEKLPPSSELRH